MEQIKQEPIPADFYNEEWHKNNPFWIYGADEKGKRRSEGVAPFLIMDTFGLWNKRILDAGAGRGWLVKFLREYGAKAIGLDYSQYSVDNSVANVQLGNMTFIEFPESSFDMVISRENFEHLTIEESDEAFKEMIRVSKEWLYLTIWLEKNPDAKDDEIYTDFDNDKSHITVCTRKFWENKFQKYIDQGIIIEDKEKEKILDWKNKGRVFVYRKISRAN